MKKLKFFALTAAFVLGCSEPNEEQLREQSLAESEPLSLNEWLNEAYDARLQYSPLTLASLGRKERYDEFDDVTEAGELAALNVYKQQVDAMRHLFDYETLSEQDQLRFDYYAYLYDRAVEEFEFRDHVYVFNQMDGVHTGYPQMVMTYHEIDSKQDATDYVSRLSGMATALNVKLAQAQSNATHGVRPPQFAYELVISESNALITGRPFDESATNSPLLDHGLQGLSALFASGKIDEGELAQIEQTLKEVLNGEIRPAYEAIIAFAESELPNATPTSESTGIGSTPRGTEYYAMLLKRYTTTDLSAEEIHQIGLNEVARITGEMNAIKESVGFEGSLAEFFDFVRTDAQFYYPNTDEGRQGYLDDSKRFIDNLLLRAPEYFSRLPKSQLEVRRVEAYREQPGAAQHYVSGFADGSKPGTYYAHLIDMQAMPKTEMESIAYHEGVPGHHFDWALSAENPDIPKFQSTHYLAFHSEGWALYTELLAKEMGGYEDPYSDFGRLMSEIFRAIRLVVDTGLHHYGWTEAEAIQYMIDHNPTAPTLAMSEIHRYQVIPGQATSYKMGMLKILELRRKAEVALGDDFDIRGFHDAILIQGGVPSELLERRVDNWIASVLRTSNN